MRQLKFILPVLATTVLAISCGNMKNDQSNEGGEKPKTFASAAEAANAAKADMLSAMDKVNFGVDKGALSTATPGAVSMKQELDWDMLLNADSNAAPEAMAKGEAVNVVPLVNGNDVVTVVSLMQRDGKFGIGALGDKQIAGELDIVRKASGAGEVNIYEVPNLTATIYAAKSDTTTWYFTSYNNASIRQGMDGRSLIQVLRRDALIFDKTYRDQLKKGELVK